MATNSAGSVAFDLTLNKSNFNRDIKNAAKGADSAFNSAMSKIKGYIVGAFSVAAIAKFTKASVDAASQMQSAWTGLKSIADGSGKSFAEAQRFINEYTKDGLVSINEAATAYKNLLSRGYDTSQIENTMNALKDSAAFGRQASYQLGEAVVGATEGLKNENSILVDNAGVTKNVAKMWEEWARAHNTTTSAMTQAQKIEAEYNGILQETKFQVGDAATYTKTFGGQVQMLKASFTSLKVAVGSVIAPLASLFIPVINSALVAITNFFNGIKSLLSVFGLEFPPVVSKTSSSISDIGSSASDAAGDIASTGGAAKKAAKEINKAFSSVDEINVLNTSKDSSGGGSGGSGGAGGGASSSAAFQSDAVTGEVKKTNGAIDAAIKKFKELKDLFMDGFDIGFKGTSFDGILKSLSNIKKSLVDIFTDPKVLGAADSWVNTVAFNMGRVIGSVAKIGTNIAEALVGSVDNYLSQNGERIKGFITNMFKISSQDINITGALFESFGTISEVLKGDVAKQIGADIMAMFYNPLMSVTQLLGQWAVDVKDIFATPIIDNVEAIKQTFEGILGPIQTVTGTLAEAFTYVGDTLTKVYDEHAKPYFESLKKGLSDSFGKFLEVYNKYFQPFVQETANDIKELWNNNLKPLWDNVSEMIGALIDRTKAIWEQWVKPFIDWCVQNILPLLVPILRTIKDTVFNVVRTIADVLSGLIKTFTGIIQFLTGVFTGDWKKAWQGVQNVFKGLIDALVGIFKSPLNGIIDGINNFTQSLKKIKIPDWVPAVGGKSINIGRIPHLANGGYVERNNPQLAIVGDNTREGEITTPESKIYEQVDKALKENRGNGIKELAITIYHKYEDGRTIIQKVNQAQIDAGEVLLLT
ncbi:MAG TPA: hypothetical protein DCW44_02895 [Eubacterium sp.]|nr:hypothetical protein [Eubacterium sp.]